MSCRFDDKSIFGSSCGGSPIKRMRRSRDERKKLNNIGKKENDMIEDENEITNIISPIRRSGQKQLIVSPSKDSIITLSNHKDLSVASPKVIHRSNQNSIQKPS